MFCLKSPPLPDSSINSKRCKSYDPIGLNLKHIFRGVIPAKQALLDRAKAKRDQFVNSPIRAENILRGMRCACLHLLNDHVLIYRAGGFELCFGRAQRSTRRKASASRDVQSISVGRFFPQPLQVPRCFPRQCSGFF